MTITMRRMLSKINKKSERPSGNSAARASVALANESPEAVTIREVTAFCQSGAPGAPNAGNEYLHLPAIVDAAESSPAAAREAAASVRHFLSRDFYAKGYAQYNAVMLTRILTDNPGRVFTQNFDAQFVSAVKRLLREGNDLSVQQILRETLDYFEAQKAPSNETLRPLMQMWAKEKAKGNALLGGPVRYSVPPSAQLQNSPYQIAPSHQIDTSHSYQTVPPRGLPPPGELAARIEEAKITARLLIQTVQSTPQSELLSNDLVQEFHQRARSAHASVQRYMNYDNPAPDADTMITLIETNDQLHMALSKYQKSVVQARNATATATSGHNVYGTTDQIQHLNTGVSTPVLRHDDPVSPVSSLPAHGSHAQSQPPSTLEEDDAYQSPSRNGRDQQTAFYASSTAHQTQAPTQAPTSTANDSAVENPFADDASRDESESQPQARYALFERAKHHINAAGRAPVQNVADGSATATNATTNQEGSSNAENK